MIAVIDDAVLAFGALLVLAIAATATATYESSRWTPTYNRPLSSVAQSVRDKVQEIDKKHRGEYYVYQLVDQNTHSVQYVGMTKDIDRRTAEHKKSPRTGDLVLGDYVGGLTYSQARPLEQQWIAAYNLTNVGRNRINSIGPNNKKIDAYLAALDDFIYNEWSNERYLVLEMFPGA